MDFFDVIEKHKPVKFRCFIISMRSKDGAPVGFDANSISDALTIATEKIGVRKWKLHFQVKLTDDAMYGLIATYCSFPYYLYIHENQGEE